MIVGKTSGQSSSMAAESKRHTPDRQRSVIGRGGDWYGQRRS